MNKLFAIADSHLSFASEKPMDVFGDVWKDHATRFASGWCASVSSADTVLVAGDISWAMKPADALVDLAYLHELPGRKILVRGNHDFWWQGITRLNALYEDMCFLQNDSVLFDAKGRTAICGARGWGLPGLEGYGADDEKILTRELLRMKLSLDAAVQKGAENLIMAMHFPPALAPANTSPFTELFAKYPVSQVVYGHLHGAAAFRKGIQGIHAGIRYSLVSCDFLKFSPLRIL